MTINGWISLPDTVETSIRLEGGELEELSTTDGSAEGKAAALRAAEKWIDNQSRLDVWGAWVYSPHTCNFYIRLNRVWK